MSKEKYLEELSDELRISKLVLKKIIYAVGTNKENIKDYAKNGSCAIVRKDNGFDVSYVAQMLNEKDAKIKSLEHRLSNCIEPKFKQSQAVFIVFENDYLKGYVDCFDFYTKKYLVHYPDEVLGDDWCSENEIFASKAEVEAKLEELKNGKV